MLSKVDEDVVFVFWGAIDIKTARNQVLWGYLSRSSLEREENRLLTYARERGLTLGAVKPEGCTL